jgi:malate/lactate dehydrogenase
MPVTLGNKGIDQILIPSFNQEEKIKLNECINIVKKNIKDSK